MRVWLLIFVCIALVSSVALFFGLAAFSGRGSPHHKKYVEMQRGGLNEPFLLSEDEYERTLTLAEAGNGKAAFKLYWYYEGGVGNSVSALYWLDKSASLSYEPAIQVSKTLEENKSHIHE